MCLVRYSQSSLFIIVTFFCEDALNYYAIYKICWDVTSEFYILFIYHIYYIFYYIIFNVDTHCSRGADIEWLLWKTTNTRNTHDLSLSVLAGCLVCLQSLYCGLHLCVVWVLVLLEVELIFDCSVVSEGYRQGKQGED